jgi:hypothetical protein
MDYLSDAAMDKKDCKLIEDTCKTTKIHICKLYPKKIGAPSVFVRLEKFVQNNKLRYSLFRADKCIFERTYLLPI